MQLGDVLASHAANNLESGRYEEHAAAIERLMTGDCVPAITARLVTAQTDSWLEMACDNFRRGCPTSAALRYELRKRSEDLTTLADVFRLKFDVSLACCAHPDLQEGIRAVLVDKDRKPRWSPSDLAAVMDAGLDGFFRPRYVGEHPLARLGAH